MATMATSISSGVQKQDNYIGFGAIGGVYYAALLKNTLDGIFPLTHLY